MAEIVGDFVADRVLSQPELEEFCRRKTGATMSVQHAIATGKWRYLGMRPKANCQACEGRGYTGIDDLTKLFIPCRCIKRRKMSAFY